MRSPPLPRIVVTVVLAGASWACLPGAQEPAPQAAPAVTIAAPETMLPSAPSATANGPGCYYTWATQELPALSETLQRELAAIDSGIHASAYAFGEDCRRDDGTATFLAMETDFRVRLPVQDLSDEAALGALISRTMALIETLPSNEIRGPRPGRVEFEFYSNGANSLRLMIEISRYRLEAPGLEGASLLQHFRPSP